MAAETCYTSRPQTPSRLSNCGEMVRQEVVRQMEEELRREAQGMRDRLQVPGRKLLVGMKFTTSCRKMLTWTIANLAQPGDQILVLHVCSLPRHAGTTEKEQDLHLQQLANTLHGVLSVYEGLCNLKQIKLQLEIVSGFKVKKVLVEVSRNHGACKLILGSNKHFSIGRSTALGKYCLKRLPCTCTVVIIEHGEIIFDKKGKLENGMARTGMLNVLRKSMRSLGRSKKVASGGSDEPDDPARPSVSLSLMFCESPFDPRASGYHEQSNELFRSSGSSASLLHEYFSTSPVSVLPSEKRNSTSGFEAFRTSLSKQPAEGALKSSSANESSSPAVERSDMFLLRDENQEEPEASAEDMPLHNAPPSSLVELSPGEDSESPKIDSSFDNKPSRPAAERSANVLLRDQTEEELEALAEDIPLHDVPSSSLVELAPGKEPEAPSVSEEPEASAEDMPLHNAPSSILVELSPGEESEPPTMDSSLDNKPSSPPAESSDNALLRDQTEKELEVLAEDIPLHDVPSSSLVELAPGKEPEAPSVSEEPEASAEDIPLHNAPPSSLVELSPGEEPEPPTIDSSFDNKPSSPAAGRSDNALLRDQTEEELEVLAEDIPLHDVPSSSLVELAPGKEPEAPSVSEEPEASAEDMPLHNAPPSSLVELSPGEDSEPPTKDSSFDNKPSSPAAERSDNVLLRDQTEEELEVLAEDIALHDVPSSSLVELAPGKEPEAPSVSEEPEASAEDMPIHTAPPSSLVELSPGEESESPTIDSSFDNKPSTPAAERSDSTLLRDQTEEELEVLAEDIPLHDVPSSSLVELAPGKEPEAPSVSEDALIPGWPLMHRTIGFEKKKLIPTSIGRDLSVVDWALQLPQRGRDPSTLPKKLSEAQCDILFGDIAQIGFITHESRGPSKLVGPSDDFYTAKIRFSIKSPTNRIRSMERFEGDGLSLEQKVDCLCLNRLCKAFSYEDLEAATSSFSQSNVVGRGGGSEVFKGELRDGQLVAVKCLRQGPQAEEELLTDIEINTSLSHVHIVSLLGYCISSSHLILVYDYLPEGNLEDQLHVGKDAPVLSWDVRYRVAVGIAKALDYLHDGCPRPVIHRDVKASNILLSANFDPQLSDFGLAKWASTNTSHICCNDVVGTFGYLAPEYFMYGRVNDRTDVYSFGVVLLELITGRVPIDTTRTKGQENLVIWARPLLEEKNLDKLVDTRLDGTYDTEQMQIMILAASLCVRQSAQRRPRISQVLELLCADQSESLSLWARHEATVSLDLDESGSSCEWTPNYGQGETDIQTHLALAMLGVDDDITSQCNSSMDIVHSSKYFEDYLEGRFSRSASFED